MQLNQSLAEDKMKRLSWLPACAHWGKQTRLKAGAPVVGVGDHAVAIEHAADVLLGPVPVGLLPLQQALGSARQHLHNSASP